MALSEQTLDHLLEAEGNIRAAIKCAAVNEKPLVVTQLSKLVREQGKSTKELAKMRELSIDEIRLLFKNLSFVY